MMLEVNRTMEKELTAKRQPVVSVIIPAYNTSEYIAETLDSVLAQTFTDYEIIVINDGSPDTAELERALEPYREHVHYLTQENRGSSGARNTGLRAARGRYIALLDSDDLWEPDYLAVHVAALESDPTLDVIYPDSLLFGDSPKAGKTFMQICPVEGEVTFARVVREQCCVYGGVTARREAIFDAGLFDEALGSGEDLELWLRILYRGGRIGYHRRVLARYRQRPGSHTSDPVWLCENFRKVAEKLKRTLELSVQDRDAVEQQLVHNQALIKHYEGKRAFFRGDAEAAIAALREANAYFKSYKISLMLLLLRAAPRLLLRAYDMRDRFVLRTNTKI
jgi:glycosyltransferase involved in cell wall biosynthesis